MSEPLESLSLEARALLSEELYRSEPPAPVRDEVFAQMLAAAVVPATLLPSAPLPAAPGEALAPAADPLGAGEAIAVAVAAKPLLSAALIKTTAVAVLASSAGGVTTYAALTAQPQAPRAHVAAPRRPAPSAESEAETELRSRLRIAEGERDSLRVQLDAARAELASIRNAPRRPVSAGRSSLEAERRLLQQARIALLSGAHGEALEALDTHARRFGAAQLAEERDALRIEALHAAGREDEARRALEEFRRSYPRSPFQGPR